MSVIAQDGWYRSEMRLTARSHGRTEAMRHAKTLGTRVFTSPGPDSVIICCVMLECNLNLAGYSRYSSGKVVSQESHCDCVIFETPSQETMIWP